jgi:hypothetical protein
VRIAIAPLAERVPPDLYGGSERVVAAASPHVRDFGLAFERADTFDVIDSHVDYLAFQPSSLVATPTLHTLHGRLDLPDLRPVFRHLCDQLLVSIPATRSARRWTTWV